jgi:hypothetical protein
VDAGLRAVGGEQERRAVQRRAAADHGAGDHRDAELGRQRGERAGLRAGHVDRALPVAAELVAPGVAARADAGPEVQALRIAAEERLGEDDELGAAARGAAHPLARAVERGLRVEERRAALHDGDGEGIGGHGTRPYSVPHSVQLRTEEALHERGLAAVEVRQEGRSGQGAPAPAPAPGHRAGRRRGVRARDGGRRQGVPEGQRARRRRPGRQRDVEGRGRTGQERSAGRAGQGRAGAAQGLRRRHVRAGNGEGQTGVPGASGRTRGSC